MGLVMKEKDIDLLKNIAERERAPMYVIGEATGDHQFTFSDPASSAMPIDLQLEDMFGNPPRTYMTDKSLKFHYDEITYSIDKINDYLEQVLQIEGIACKDWLTNKVDRSVTGRVAKQQCAGSIQLPLNNLAVLALDYQGNQGIATSLGHAAAAAIIDPAAGSILSIAESLTNIIWAPLQDGLKGVSLSANWMWPCRNAGEDARLYTAVKAASDFALALGINIPTGKDSMSMSQKYPDGSTVLSPGTVIISASAQVSDIKNVVEPVLKNSIASEIIYVDFSKAPYSLGGSSFGQIMNKLGNDTPTIADADYFIKLFGIIQQAIIDGEILAGHDISSGGMITTLLEMCFAEPAIGLSIKLDSIGEKDTVKLLFSENPGLILQIKSHSPIIKSFKNNKISFHEVGYISNESTLKINNHGWSESFAIDKLRDIWFKTSYFLDRKQSGEKKALERYSNYKQQALQFTFPKSFKGTFDQYGIDPKRKFKSGIRAAIIREKGVNGDREMAWMMHLAGLDVKDVHMTDLVSGRETLDDIKLIVFVGGFSNSDVLGSAKGWAGAFLYNEKAKKTLERFYARPDTLSLGVCNGCQLVIELGLITPEHTEKPKMLHNESNKFESAFLNVVIPNNNSIMLGSLVFSWLGVWVAHGEGKFSLPYDESKYQVAMKYANSGYPGNPNGSDYNIAGICSVDGRHLAIMPHPERAIYPWNWAKYPENRKDDEVSPWIEIFVNAREWIKRN
jgi:phosphoribosylformylglycinamidine synthase